MRVDNDLSGYSIMSVVVGTVCMFLWLIPIVSVFGSLLAIHIGIKGYHSEQGSLSKVGIYLGVISLALALIRSGLLNGFI